MFHLLHIAKKDSEPDKKTVALQEPLAPPEVDQTTKPEPDTQEMFQIMGHP